MFVKFTVIALAVSMAACSQTAPAQAPAQSDKAQAPAQASTPPPAASHAAPEKPANPAPEPATPPTAEKTAPAEPRFREVTIPSGTALSVRLSTPVASDTSKVEDEVRGTLTTAIVVAGVTAVPAGAEVVGTVRDAKRSGRVKGLASVAFRFERLIVRDESLAVRTATISREAAANRRDDVKKGAIGGAAGAIVGGIVGGGDGAAIGASVGGAGAVLATRGDEVRLPAGTSVRTTLQQPLKVVVPRPNGS